MPVIANYQWFRLPSVGRPSVNFQNSTFNKECDVCKDSSVDCAQVLTCKIASSVVRKRPVLSPACISLLS